MLFAIRFHFQLPPEALADAHDRSLLQPHRLHDVLDRLSLKRSLDDSSLVGGAISEQFLQQVLDDHLFIRRRLPVEQIDVVQADFPANVASLVAKGTRAVEALRRKSVARTEPATQVAARQADHAREKALKYLPGRVRVAFAQTSEQFLKRIRWRHRRFPRASTSWDSMTPPRRR